MGVENQKSHFCMVAMVTRIGSYLEFTTFHRGIWPLFIQSFKCLTCKLNVFFEKEKKTRQKAKFTLHS